MRRAGRAGPAAGSSLLPRRRAAIRVSARRLSLPALLHLPRVWLRRLGVVALVAYFAGGLAYLGLRHGVLPNVPGFLNAAFPAAFPDVPEVFKLIYTYAWFIGLALAALVYRVAMRGKA